MMQFQKGLLYVFMGLTFCGIMASQRVIGQNVGTRMENVIQKNWKLLSVRLLELKTDTLLECMPAIDGKKYGAIAVKGYEVEGEAVYAIAFIFKNKEKMEAAYNQLLEKDPFKVNYSLLPRNGELLVWVYTQREDEDGKMIAAEVSGVITLKE